ncbi:MAG: sigma-70 family RNA polymerase sigma factor [Ruminococcaceae bacterium]|nr:sigma-70 family RNA polymerase sigma factor [Oscillospiraceae bacterium]
MKEIELHEKIAEVSKTIFSYCMAKTPTREEAEDLSQDILCELIKSVENIRDDRAFYAFMWGVAGNVYKQWYRKKLKNNTCELTDNIPAEDDFIEDNGSDIYLLRRELALLSEKYRKATILYYIHGRSCSEISSALAISESMAKYLLFKSRKMLKEGMSMERNLGELSYNPKTLIPLYNGQGPNQFGQFMQSKIKQNIVSACYNDALTVQQISLETGIPLPYLDDEIKELENRMIIVKDGKHYKANIIIITAECADEIERAVTKYHEPIANKMESFISANVKEYKAIGFIGSDFSENTLRWQLTVALFRMIFSGYCRKTSDAPKTAWGEPAFLWCVEKLNEKHIFNICDVDSNHGDRLYFFDYWKDVKGKGDHHDFYGNERYINIFCDICRGSKMALSEYDLEAIAEMIKKGYVIKENETYRATIPIYTFDQYNAVVDMVQAFISNELISVIQELDRSAAKILSAHTPKHLQNQVNGIASMDKFVNAVCIPATILMDRQVLSTAWHPLEMPTTYVVLK